MDPRLAERVALVKRILNSNWYLTLSTVDENNNPWVSPVFFVTDKQSNFYWISAVHSQHSENIARNHKVAAIVYDTQAAFGMGNGVYIKGTVEIVSDDKVEGILEMITQRKRETSPDGQVTVRDASGFKADSPWKIYQLTAAQVWTLKESFEPKGYPGDFRVEVPVSELKSI